MQETFTKESLKKTLSDISKQKPKITIIGDLMLDEYLIGYPERISREAPVVILEHEKSFYKLGGASNAALNAAKFGAEVTIIGILGKDYASGVFRELCQENHINLKTLETESRHTTLKTRVLSTNQGRHFSAAGTSATQQVLRIDKVTREALSEGEKKELLALVEDMNFKSQDAILLSDYSLNVLNKELLDLVFKKGKENKIIVDPSGNFSRFKECSLITPNQPDTEKELSMRLDKLGTDEYKTESLLYERLREIFSEKTSFLITRGAEGMLLLENGYVNAIPAFNKTEVFDVTGAGDTVSACMSFCLASGLSSLMSIYLSNLAASIVVRKPGAATTSVQEMLQCLETLDIPAPKTIKVF